MAELLWDFYTLSARPGHLIGYVISSLEDELLINTLFQADCAMYLSANL